MLVHQQQHPWGPFGRATADGQSAQCPFVCFCLVLTNMISFHIWNICMGTSCVSNTALGASQAVWSHSAFANKAMDICHLNRQNLPQRTAGFSMALMVPYDWRLKMEENTRISGTAWFEMMLSCKSFTKIKRITFLLKKRFWVFCLRFCPWFLSFPFSCPFHLTSPGWINQNHHSETTCSTELPHLKT